MSAALVVMGAAGAGKSVVGARLADHLGVGFVDGDALHDAEALAKLAAGTPLTDDDRWPWLERQRAWLDGHPRGVLACSALRRAYRDVLRPAVFVHLVVPEAVLRARVAARTGHVMPASLVPSQVATLEPLEPDEEGLAVDASGPVDRVVEEVLARIG